MHRKILAALAVACLLAAAPDAGAEKIEIERADDLPRHSYTIQGKAVDLFADHEQLLALAREVEKDLRADLETYEIADATTLKGYYQVLGTIAMMEGRYDEYRDLLKQIIELEDKEAQRLLAGLVPLAWIDAIRQPETPFDEAFGAALRRRVNNLPYEVVEANIKQQKGMMEIVSRPLLEGMVDGQVQPQIDASDGVVTKDIAQSLISQGFAVHSVLPHKEIIVGVLADYLDAHAVEKEDIWQARAVDLEGEAKLSEVVIGVWDSGVDEEVFTEIAQIWTNPGEALNGKDDDGNGFVDDLHGIAYDKDGNVRVAEPLYPIGDVEDVHLLQRRMKGLRDVQNSIDSAEASELKKTMGSLTQAEVESFIESISAYGNHAHGTHVAGIASEGNPAARVLNARLSFGHEMIPDKPTRAITEAWAKMYHDTVAYFVANDVRVVNMSWGGSISDIESALAAHNDPADTEERKALAREFYEIMKTALTEAMASAPDILFCVAAGNSNNDNVFEEMIPSSIELPNIITVGAVDQAGEETSFTTFGKVDVYANGFNVESYVPGGDRLPLNGTSMASPQVANLAAKILAKRPELGPVAVKELIIETADSVAAGERTVRRIHPLNAMAEVSQMPKSSRR